MNIVEWAFGKRMTPAERLRKNQRALEKAQRELDRERGKLELQEKKLIQEIKKSAKNNQLGAAKIQAKDLVRTRKYISKFYEMRTRLQAISLQIQTVRSNEQMMQSMKGATSLLRSMSQATNIASLQEISMQFARESDMMEQREEIMTDAIDDVTGLEDEEEEDEVLNQVLDEIGVDREMAHVVNHTAERHPAFSRNTVQPGQIRPPDIAFHQNLKAITLHLAFHIRSILAWPTQPNLRLLGIAPCDVDVDCRRKAPTRTRWSAETQQQPHPHSDTRPGDARSPAAVAKCTGPHNCAPVARVRRRSNDDENLYTTWRTPGKLAVNRDEKALAHSRSAVDLSKLASESSAVGDSISEGGQPNLIRQRRSTRANSILAGTIFENAATRQKKLSDATVGKLVDSFFTLHHESVGEYPFYISEVVPMSINPTFQSFELAECGPAITRLDSVIVRVWARKDPRASYSLMMDLNLGLSYLNFIGRSLEDCKFTFPNNCVIFVLSDGCYTIFSDLDPKLIKNFGGPRSKIRAMVPREAVETCSFDAILKMRNLEDCIYDAKETQAILEGQMDSTAVSKAEYLSHVRTLDEENLELKDARKAIVRETKRLDTLRKHRDALKQSISGRKAAIDAGVENRAVAKKHLHNAKLLLHHSIAETNATAASIVSRRRTILDDLAKIYPIDHIPEQPLNFTICHLHLPNGPPEGHNEDVIAAALGYIAHLVYILSFYLSVYLRYPVIPKGSSSMVQDPISVIQGSRFFPLWAKGVPYFRFEYAIFLLNKNIEQLMESQDCIVLNIQQTLPNLKYLLYVTTASKTPMSIEERPSKLFSLPINRRAPSALAEASANGAVSSGGSGCGGSGAAAGEALLSRSVPKNVGAKGGFASVSPSGSLSQGTISFKRDFRKTQDVL
ncbi:hypothetical protein DRE_02288 [Drechslerella stenobrocha 248]|uniref:Autophagy-related protein 14 n=1 Tax=Drechslerella stenobrocha 248 TaxID=1043628 RepID=W7HXE5_9PEZI|nr:hypothetical protein DRE_02288 [Drechslerella stenobrocha 248]